MVSLALIVKGRSRAPRARDSTGLAAAVGAFGEAAPSGLLDKDRDEVADRAVGEGLVFAVHGLLDLLSAQLGELFAQSLSDVADRLPFGPRVAVVQTASCHAAAPSGSI